MAPPKRKAKKGSKSDPISRMQQEAEQRLIADSRRASVEQAMVALHAQNAQEDRRALDAQTSAALAARTKRMTLIQSAAGSDAAPDLEKCTAKEMAEWAHQRCPADPAAQALETGPTSQPLAPATGIDALTCHRRLTALSHACRREREAETLRRLQLQRFGWSELPNGAEARRFSARADSPRGAPASATTARPVAREPAPPPSTARGAHVRSSDHAVALERANARADAEPAVSPVADELDLPIGIAKVWDADEGRWKPAASRSPRGPVESAAGATRPGFGSSVVRGRNSRGADSTAGGRAGAARGGAAPSRSNPAGTGTDTAGAAADTATGGESAGTKPTWCVWQDNTAEELSRIKAAFERKGMSVDMRAFERALMVPAERARPSCMQSLPRQGSRAEPMHKYLPAHLRPASAKPKGAKKKTK